MANDYIYFKGTKCTDLKAYNTNGTLKKQVNYAYYKPLGSSYATCVYKRPDPALLSSGYISVSNQDITSATLTVDDSLASYQYPSYLFRSNPYFITVKGTNPTNTVSDGNINLTFKNQYYTPVDANGIPISSDDISYFKYNISGTFYINSPYYNIGNDISGRHGGTFKISSAVLNESNKYQYKNLEVDFTWTNAVWLSLNGNGTVLISSGERIARDIYIVRIRSDIYLYLRTSSTSANLYSKNTSNDISLKCVKSSIYPILYLDWNDSDNGKTSYFSYRNIQSLNSSNSAPNTYGSWQYTESTSVSYSLYNFNKGNTDIHFSTTESNLIAYINYSYLTFTWVSGYNYTITNNDKISHTVYYNKKKCNSGDAKNWTGLSDVTSVILSAGGFVNITLQSNWFANAQTCSFTTRTYRYISYIVDGDSTYSTNKVSI